MGVTALTKKLFSYKKIQTDGFYVYVCAFNII
jgi:hypothetical protein